MSMDAPAAMVVSSALSTTPSLIVLAVNGSAAAEGLSARNRKRVVSSGVAAGLVLVPSMAIQSSSTPSGTGNVRGLPSPNGVSPKTQVRAS